MEEGEEEEEEEKEEEENEEERYHCCEGKKRRDHEEEIGMRSAQRVHTRPKGSPKPVCFEKERRETRRGEEEEKEEEEEEGDGGKDKLARHCPNRGDSFFLLPFICIRLILYTCVLHFALRVPRTTPDQ